MVIELGKRVSASQYRNKLHIIQGDILKVDLPYFNVIVANV